MGNTFNTGRLINGLFVDASGNVGIGTTTPAEKLSVIGNIRIDNGAADGGQLVLASSGFSDWNLDNFSGRFRAYYGATEYFTILANGRMGVGTNAPVTNTQISGTNGVTDSFGQLFVSTTNTATQDFGGQITLGGFFNGTTNQTAFGAIAGRKENSTANNALGYLSFSTQNGTITERMRITSSGNVGIGTSTPTEMLHLNNSSTNAAFIRFQNTGGSGVYIGGRNNDMELYAGGSERMRITSSGNVGIGTTTPSSKLHLYNGGNPLSIQIQRTTVPVFFSDVQIAGTTAGAVWSHNVENTSNGSFTWGGFTNGSYGGSAIMLNANTGNSWITFLAAPSANTNPTERFRIFGDNGYSVGYKEIGNIASTSLSSFGDAQVQRYYFYSQCNNTWRTVVANINFRHFFIRIWGSDAGTRNYGEYYFTMSFPGYGVSNNANLHYVSGGWNTGGFELTYTNNGGAYYLIFRNTSYYDSNNVATYFIEMTAV